MNPDKKVRRVQSLLYTSGLGTVLFSIWSGIRGLESLFEIWKELAQEHEAIDITRIWASFHFLPYDLYAPVKALSPTYRSKYRLICKPNGDLIVKTVELAKNRDLESVGLAMHILADTWAHAYFAGTPSQVINNTDFEFYEVMQKEENSFCERHVVFQHNPVGSDNPEKGVYNNSINDGSENSVMNLGHGRAGRLPDYSFAHYKYQPAWGNYEVVEKNNPEEYEKAFCQMIYAMKYLRGEVETFEKEIYDFDAIFLWRNRIRSILTKRQLIACEEWKAFGEELSGCEITPFDLSTYETAYMNAAQEEKDNTSFGRFILAAMRQKSMVTNAVFASGNMLAGFSVDYWKKGFKGIKDFREIVKK